MPGVGWKNQEETGHFGAYIVPEDKPLFSPVFSVSLPIICLKISHIDGNMDTPKKEMIDHETTGK